MLHSPIRMKFHSFLYIISTLLFLSCQKNDNLSPSLPEIYEKTLIAYLAGDNNLSAEIDSKIDALVTGFLDVDETQNKLIVFADYRDRNSLLLEISHHGVTTLQTFDDLDAADPSTLQKIISQVYSLFPAKSYGLLCFSHASGWLPQGAFSNPLEYDPSRSKSLIMDGDHEMSIADFAKAIRLPDQSKYDFILFETCHMAGIEVAYSLRDVSSRMLASSAEIVSPGFLECYKKDLKKLFTNPADVFGFGTSFFDLWDSQSGARRSATVSVLNLDQLDSLAAEAGRIVRQGNPVSNPENIQHFDRNLVHMFFDLREYLLAVTGYDESQLTDFDDLLKHTIEYENATPSFLPGYPYSFKIDKHCGLTIYIQQPELETLNEAYRETDFYMDNMN